MDDILKYKLGLKEYIRNQPLIQDLSDNDLDNIFNEYVTVVPPQRPNIFDYIFDYLFAGLSNIVTPGIIAIPDSTTGRTTKLCNIKIDIKKFFEKAPDLLLSISSMPNKSFLTALALLKIIYKLYDFISINLERQQIIILHTINKTVGFGEYVDENILKNKVKDECVKHNLLELKDDEFYQTVNSLEKINCIAILECKIKLIEHIVKDFQ